MKIGSTLLLALLPLSSAFAPSTSSVVVRSWSAALDPVLRLPVSHLASPVAQLPDFSLHRSPTRQKVSPLQLAYSKQKYVSPRASFDALHMSVGAPSLRRLPTLIVDVIFLTNLIIILTCYSSRRLLPRAKSKRRVVKRSLTFTQRLPMSPLLSFPFGLLFSPSGP